MDEEGNGTLVQPRLYQLVREPGEITDRTFEITDRTVEITFLDAGVEAYVFTFGEHGLGRHRAQPPRQPPRALWPTDRPSFRATAQNIPSVRGKRVRSLPCAANRAATEEVTECVQGGLSVASGQCPLLLVCEVERDNAAWAQPGEDGLETF